MLDKIIKRMEEDPEHRFAGEYFKNRVADLRGTRSDMNYGICAGYLSCLRTMGFITDEEERDGLKEIGEIYCGRERAATE